MLAVVLLVTTVSLITRISLLSPYKICTTLGYISLFAIAFGGQTSVSSNIFFASTCLTVLGIICMVFDGVTYYFLDIILSGDYLSFDSWTAFYLGILNGLHLLTTSPLLYQQYFSLSSCRRLRESQIIHIGLFCILTGAILMSPNFFPNKINSFCPGSLPVFSNVTLENKFQETIGSSLITTLLALITSFGIIFTLLALTNLIWEDLLRPWLVRRPLQQQLGLLQLCNNCFFANFKLCFSTLVTPMTALYTCSYIFPFLNGKGATVGLLIGILGAVTLFYLYFRIMPLRFHHYSKPCLNETSVTYSWLWPDCKFANSDLDFVPVILQEMIRKAQKVPSILCEVPVTWYPLATFTITSLSMLLVSLCTSGNFNEFDYRLIICPPYIRIATRHADNINNHKGVAFVECESFRYAQQTPYPDTVVSVTNAIR
uniref:Uncharacterized protein n=1 Tax=Setaria digitata TaxID=48799 RepID=A0A915PV19_9BILA